MTGSSKMTGYKENDKTQWKKKEIAGNHRIYELFFKKQKQFIVRPAPSPLHADRTAGEKITSLL